MNELTEGRYRELLHAGPQMKMEDVERLKDFEPSLSTIASSILVAYPMQRMSKRAAKKAKAFAVS